MSLLNEVMELARRVDDSEFVKEYNLKEHKFMTMEEEKRERVINAALGEFAKGYLAANTDLIVKAAGISKGLLFHYFGSKRGLFLFLIKYALGIIMEEFEKVISESRDFFENIKIVARLEADLILRYPLIFGFLVKAHSSIKDVFPEGLPGDLPNSSHMLLQLICQRSSHDESLFREGIDSEKAQNIILWTMNGLADSLYRYDDDIEAYEAHYNEMTNEVEEYLQILRRALYR